MIQQQQWHQLMEYDDEEKSASSGNACACAWVEERC